MAKKTEYLLIDGYNVIYAWSELKAAADGSLESARIKLLDTVCNYQGIKQINIIVVFDAHKVNRGIGSVESYSNITVVYTKEAETADNYIERVTSTLAKQYQVTVVTSDALEQLIIIGKGAHRMSALDFYNDVQHVQKKIRAEYTENRPIKKNMLINNLDAKTASLLESMRQGMEDDKK